MSKRKRVTRTKRAGHFIGRTLKTTGEGVQYFARGLKFWFGYVTSFAGELKDGVKEGRRG